MAGAAFDHIDGRSGMRRSISAALGPMFCARAWQARWTVTPSGSGCKPVGQALLLRDHHDIFVDVEGRPASRFTSAFSGTISGHSNLSISAQDAVSVTMS